MPTLTVELMPVELDEFRRLIDQMDDQISSSYDPLVRDDLMRCLVLTKLRRAVVDELSGNAKAARSEARRRQHW